MRLLKRIVIRLVRAPLVRHARAVPRAADRAGAERRVTILLSSAWGMGGTIRTTLSVAAHLSHRYDVEIITAYRRREAPFFGAFPPGVTVTPLDDQRRGRRVSRLQRLLRSWPSVLMHRADHVAVTFSLWTDLRLVRLLRRRTGFLLTTRPAFNLLAAELRLPGLVVVGEEHLNRDQHNQRLLSAIERLYPQLDALVVLTARDARAYRELLGERTPVYRVPNAVRPLRGAPADLSAKTVFTAGRLVPQKGFDVLVEAFASVAGAHPDWNLRICGRGRERELLEGLVAEHGLEGRVLLEGPVKDIGSAMSRASIFAMTSRAEGFPLVLLEAMSKGMAVVSFDCPTGPADVIEDHVNGLLVPPMDVDTFAASLSELMDDEPLRRRCAAAAVAAARRYSPEAVLPQWNALLDEIWHHHQSRSTAADRVRT